MVVCSTQKCDALRLFYIFILYLKQLMSLTNILSLNNGDKKQRTNKCSEFIMMISGIFREEKKNTNTRILMISVIFREKNTNTRTLMLSVFFSIRRYYDLKRVKQKLDGYGIIYSQINLWTMWTNEMKL